MMLGFTGQLRGTVSKVLSVLTLQIYADPAGE